MEVRRFFSVALFATLLLITSVSPIVAETSQTDPAVKLLLQAQLQFQNQAFVSARASLWKAYQKRSELSAPQRKMLAERLGEVDRAIEGKVVAQAVYAMAAKAMQVKDWQLARDGFAKAAVSPYLSAGIRRQARDQMAAAEKQAADDLHSNGVPSPVIASGAIASESKEFDEPVAVLARNDEAKSDQVPAIMPAKTTKKLATSPAVEDKKSKKSAGKAAKPAGGAMTELQAKKINAGKLIAQGKDALNKKQPSKAVRYFERALRLDPDNESARRMLDFARQQTAQTGESSILSDLARQKRVAIEMAKHDMQDAMKRSMELMADPEHKSTFDEAEQAAKVARNVLQDNKSLFTVNEYREKLAKIDDQISWIRQKCEIWNKIQVKAAYDKVLRLQTTRQVKTKLLKAQKIGELTKRADALQKSGKYQQALRVLQQIIELDPDHPWADKTAFALRSIILIESQKKMSDAKKHELAKLSAAIRGSEIPWYDKIRYPSNWKALTARRKRYSAGGTDSEENRRIEQKLNQRLTNVNLVDVRFQDAIDFIREHTDANIHVNWNVLKAENEEIEDKKVTVRFSNVPAKTVLNTILKDAGGGDLNLGYVINEGVIEISTQEKLNDMTYPRVYDIHDLLVRIPNFVGPRVDLEAIGETDTSSTTDSGSGGSSTLFPEDGEGERPAAGEDDMPTREEKVKTLVKMVKETIERDSWYPDGTAAINELNGSLVITQTAKNHRAVRKLISQLRESRIIQVSIEARFITVNTGFLSQIGVDLDMYFNIGSKIGAPGAYEALPTGATAPLYGIDPVDGTGYPYGPPLGWGATTTDPYTGARVPVHGLSTWNGAGARAQRQMANFSPIGVQNSSSSFANLLGLQTNVPGGGIGTLIGAGNSAMSIAGTFLDDIQVDFLIRATQAHASSRLLTAPRITLFNGQRSYVSVATQQAYIAGLEPLVADNATAYRPIVSYAPSGTMLDVDATVSHDRRYVTLTLRPQVVTLNISQAAGSVGGITYSQGIGLPNITLQDLQTTVSIPDGGTLLIGGQKLSGEIEREMGVPVVSKLPIINRAFTNKGKLRDEQTLLVLVKPSILIQDELELDPTLRTEVPAHDHGFSY
ncbi:MAG: hypothetical protein K8S55_04555 [Phycisphaerae bacterium]|nr:hypothetical protein [Phycisphaerae bacterium]